MNGYDLAAGKENNSAQAMVGMIHLVRDCQCH
jgi:hypothetical protein